VLWYGYNPTFHRYVEYGLVLTSEALYWHKSLWSFSRWRRFPLSDVRSVTTDVSGARPCIRLRIGDSTKKLYTPFDFYSDDMEFDTKVLEKAVEAIAERLDPPRPPTVSPNISLQRDRVR
jgi:hypothetical protein